MLTSMWSDPGTQHTASSNSDWRVSQRAASSTSPAGSVELPAGAANSNPLDLLNSRRMGTILSTLAGLADVVLLDAPPITVVSDAAILASQTDGVLLVVQIGKTRREQAQQAKDLLNRARARLLGAIMLNAVTSCSKRLSHLVRSGP